MIRVATASAALAGLIGLGVFGLDHPAAADVTPITMPSKPDPAPMKTADTTTVGSVDDDGYTHVAAPPAGVAWATPDSPTSVVSFGPTVTAVPFGGEGK